MSDLPSPPAIDYTSRDYNSILNDLLSIKQTFVPDWTSTSANDIGVALLELYAYVADGMHYYTDRIANEAFLETATQRASVIRLARLLGYTPGGSIASTVTLTFANNGSSAATIPAGTQVATSLNDVDESPVTFETDSDLTVTAGSSGTVTAHQGVTVANENVGTSDGSLDQSFALFQTPVIEGTVSVTVDEGVATEWTQVTHLLNSGPNDKVYTLEMDENNVTYVRFGDGANGKVPNLGATITATYRVGGGSVGNVPAASITKIMSGNIAAGVTVTNQADATGGADLESTDSIRDNAPKALTTLQRAVTLDDYANLAVQVDGVAKASATAETPTAITVHVAPSGGGAPSGDLITAVKQQLQVVAMANTTVTVKVPTYVDVDVNVTLHVSNQYTQSRVLAAATAALLDLFAFDNVIFEDQFTIGDVALVLSNVEGVSWADIITLALHGETGTGPLSFAVDEIPQLQSANLTVTLTGGIA